MTFAVAAAAVVAVVAIPVVAAAAPFAGAAATGVGAAATGAGAAATSVTVTGTMGTTVTGATTLVGELAITGISMGPVGWAILGSENKDQTFTFDCWKPILHDNSTQPSTGILLRDIIKDSRIQDVWMTGEGKSPQIFLRNIWQEEFQLDYVALPKKQINLHAVRTN